jgi:hypothetical protein
MPYRLRIIPKVYFFILQSASITTNVVSSNPAHGEMYSIQHYVLKFVSDLRKVSGFLQVLQFRPPRKLTLNPRPLNNNFGYDKWRLSINENFSILELQFWKTTSVLHLVDLLQILYTLNINSINSRYVIVLWPFCWKWRKHHHPNPI